MKTTLKSLSKAVAFCAVSMGYASSAFSDVYPRVEWDDPAPWTHVASACVPDESALTKYAMSYADLYFKGSAVSDFGTFGLSPLSARCNVDNPLAVGVKPVWNTFIVGYKDPDGKTLNNGVTARLIKISRATGGISTVATFNSNASPVTVRGEGYVLFEHAFDYHNNAYMVQLDLYRTDATLPSPVVYSVRLVNSSKLPG